MTEIKERGDRMEEACGVFGIYAQDEAINGAKNAALIAVSILALQDAELAARLEAFRAKQTADVLAAEL